MKQVFFEDDLILNKGPIFRQPPGQIKLQKNILNTLNTIQILNEIDTIKELECDILG